MKIFIKTKKAFTLIEVIIAALIMGIVGTASMVAVSTLFRAGETARNRDMALNLLQKSDEEVRRVAQNIFDQLNACKFPEEGSNTCGFDELKNIDIGLDINDTDPGVFEGFARTLEVIDQVGTTNLKKATVRVEWTEFGKSRALHSVILIARPPDPQPGNIVGLVKDSQSDVILDDVYITVSHQIESFSKSVTSVEELAVNPAKGNFPGANYDFAEILTNGDRRVLPSGAYNFTAVHDDYLDYSQVVNVTSDQDTMIDFVMDPRPEDGSITVNLFNAFDGSPIVFTDSSSFIQIAQNGSVLKSKGAVGTLVWNSIQFSDPSDQEFFTVRTNNAYYSLYAGNFSCNPGPPPSLFPEGWTSAIVQDDGSIVCTSQFYGSSSLDRILVEAVPPNNDVTVNIPLVPVPMAIIQGHVYDNQGNPLKDADIRVKWHDNHSFRYFSNATNSSGFYSVSVPANQEMYPNQTSNYLKVRARAKITYQRCCDVPVTTDVNTSYERVGPLFTGSVVTQDFVVSKNDYVCGDADGFVKNMFTSGGGISGVDVDIQTGGDENTDGAGFYDFECSNGGYRIRAGNRHVSAQKSGFYKYNTQGSSFWYANRPRINIKANKNTAYQIIRLWPEGDGDIVITVLDNANDQPLQGMDVRLTEYDGSTKNDSTNGSGEANYNNVDETWPPVGLPGDSYFSQSSRLHNIKVTDPSGNYVSSGTVTLPALNKNSTLNFTIRLNSSQGGL